MFNFDAIATLIKTKTIKADQIHALVAKADNADTQQVAQNIENLIQRQGTNFVGAITVTFLKAAELSKGNKDRRIVKVGFKNLTTGADYEKSVKRSSTKLGESAEHFEKKETYFEPATGFVAPIMRHKKNHETLYFYGFTNNAKSVMFDLDNGAFVTYADLEPIMTPSAYKKATSFSEPTKNVSHGISHQIKPTLIGLAGMVAVSAERQKVAV